MDTDIFKDKEICTRVFRCIIEYVKETKGAQKAQEVFNVVGIPKDMYDNANLWLSRELEIKLFGQIKRIYTDSNIFRTIGSNIASYNKVGLLLSIIRPISGPAKLYQLVPTYDKKFSRINTFKIVMSGNNFVTYQFTMDRKYAMQKEDLDFIAGVLSAIPKVWNLRQAESTLTEIDYSTNFAIIRVDWTENISKS